MSDRESTPGPEAVDRRDGDRQCDDARRQFRVNYRRARVADLISRDGLGRGQQARFARALGVSTTTISRDVAALLALVAPCPYCGSYPLRAAPLPERTAGA